MLVEDSGQLLPNNAGKKVRSQFIAVVAKPNKRHKYNSALLNLIPKNVIAIKPISAKCIFLIRRS